MFNLYICCKFIKNFSYPMIRIISNILLLLVVLIFNNPVYSIDISQKAIEKYTFKISRKFSNTYCNAIKFGISDEGALKFSIGETNKEFSNNKLNNYIDHDFLSKNILSSLKNNCQIFNFPESELDKLGFDY